MKTKIFILLVTLRFSNISYSYVNDSDPKNLPYYAFYIDCQKKLHGRFLGSCTSKIKTTVEEIAKVVGGKTAEEITKNLASTVTLNLSRAKTTKLIKDISPLSGLRQLQYLNLGSQGVKDLTPLKDLTQLQYLCLKNNRIETIKPLQSLTKIQDLHLNENPIRDLKPLGKLINIQRLKLSGGPYENFDKKQNGIGQLRKLSNLKSLRLQNVKLKDISHIAKNKNLQFLDIRSNELENVDFIEELNELRSLRLNSTQIKDLEPIGLHRKLRSLCLYNLPVSDISSLRVNTELQHLELNQTGIKNISPIIGLPRLHSFVFNGLNIKVLFLSNQTQD